MAWWVKKNDGVFAIVCGGDAQLPDCNPPTLANSDPLDTLIDVRPAGTVRVAHWELLSPIFDPAEMTTLSWKPLNGKASVTTEPRPLTSPA